ncbi:MULTISPECIES: type II 3-dehydroquinate dehydratase [unclassified Mesobacillus]|uniref:type II 3-dehydroquinate dehydratase n=1 Tax=unclassified Mesobacillus TaxID=2675270 RepID=UPI00203B25D2|nr:MULTISPECIES: type II 3-dehydroquinate dehydratase [unclassified Mesobacillus]MCM3122366.1 type II 3-dehydroquinate dehydratase [Mesobacillus sp. MER 33]MCM3232330.1 type II 3-dehydroquinate dehydratase [Mesobacillus sp. MER 48]
MKKILMLNGPNLNRLGKREPGIYGVSTLSDLEKRMIQLGAEKQMEVVCFQSNHEGELIDKLHEAEDTAIDGIIFNPGAFTHYSYAIRDAIAGISCPVIEVHISNVYQREEFRHKSVIAPVSTGQIAGLGLLGYELALEAFKRVEG